MIDGDGGGVGFEEEVALDEAVIEGECIGGGALEEAGFPGGSGDEPIGFSGFGGWLELAGIFQELCVEEGGQEEQG